MNLILYTKKNEFSRAKLRVMFESLVSKDEIEIFHSTENLRNRLLRTSYKDGIVVLVAEKREELSELLPILHLFRNQRVAMIFAVDEYGGIEGIVTPADILEALTGLSKSN